MILNLRNILDNFIRYGIQFGQTPTAFVPIDYIIALFLIVLFPLFAFGVEKLKFKNILAPAIAVNIIISLEISVNIKSVLPARTQYFLLYIV